MLPISSRTEGRRALIVGGGAVALRKAESLLAAGMTVTVVAPRVDARLAAIAHCFERGYETADVSGADLVVAATGDTAVNARVVSDARAAHILCSDATEIGERFGAAHAAAARIVAGMRAYVHAVATNDERAAVMREVSDLPIEELAKMNPSQAEHEVESIMLRLREDDRHRSTNAVICATRASALAMTQTKLVAARLAERGIATTLLNITTMGDRVQDKPIAAIGVNVWVKELEVALLEKRADYAVHSCKDLPGELTLGMRLAAISAREDARDAFCSERYASFEELPPGAIVGTSSLRRRAFLYELRSDLRYQDVRGNVDTRLRKLRDGQYDAIVLAMAGLNRLNVRATHTVPFPLDVLVPAVGQGALAVETRDDDAELANALARATNDRITELCVSTERAALRALRAGCNAPLGIHATFSSGATHVVGAYANVETNEITRHSLSAPTPSVADAEALGSEFARALSLKMSTS